ncbi:Hypothetical protein SRAE_X000065900 [Strongyloides ratti]|uniref:Transthyretin-like family-containing protein n=1 Tax=Strongyloides ratti TaxID=34506 RepID=A0A090LSZ3_STRRB|nr:Hypothetical protein SRAE_X000065900 [Strongyloides ratti]CEF71332.1 Hypothetical protein SRAE_X000065900 [Strongyloides ratti]
MNLETTYIVLLIYQLLNFSLSKSYFSPIGEVSGRTFCYRIPEKNVKVVLTKTNFFRIRKTIAVTQSSATGIFYFRVPLNYLTGAILKLSFNCGDPKPMCYYTAWIPVNSQYNRQNKLASKNFFLGNIELSAQYDAKRKFCGRKSLKRFK